MDIDVLVRDVAALKRFAAKADAALERIEGALKDMDDLRKANEALLLDDWPAIEAEPPK